MTVPITNAFYVKLGVGGCWEDDSLANAYIRVGFPHQNVGDINAGNWAKIKKQLDAEPWRCGNCLPSDRCSTHSDEVNERRGRCVRGGEVSRRPRGRSGVTRRDR